MFSVLNLPQTERKTVCITLKMWRNWLNMSSHTQYFYYLCRIFFFVVHQADWFCKCFDQVLAGLKQGYFSFQSSGYKRTNMQSLHSVLTLRPPAQGHTLSTHAQGGFILKRRGKTTLVLGLRYQRCPLQRHSGFLRGVEDRARLVFAASL